MTDLTKISARFHRAYKNNTTAKERLAKRQQELFQAFTHTLAEQPLARRSVRYEHWEKLTETEQQKWLKLHHPGFKFVDYHNGNLILEEDPALLKFTYVNPENATVFGRDRVEGSPGLDDETLRAEQPELWERITDWPEPWYSLVQGVIRDFTSLPCRPYIVEQRAGSYLEKAGLQRVLKPFDQLSDKDIMAMEQYFLPGPVSVRLRPPREAKPEELEYVQEEA